MGKGTPLRTITRTDRVAKLVKGVRERRLADAKKNKRPMLRREARTAQFEQRRGARVALKLDEATLNAAEAILYAASGDLDPKDVLGLSREDAVRIARFGVGLLERDDAASAEACGRVATTLAPQEALGWVVLGCASARQRKDTQAIIAYQQATTLAPNNLRAWVDLGELYIRKMELALGAKALQRALELDPGATHPVTQRAQVLIINTLMTLEEMMADEPPKKAADRFAKWKKAAQGSDVASVGDSDDVVKKAVALNPALKGAKSTSELVKEVAQVKRTAAAQKAAAVPAQPTTPQVALVSDPTALPKIDPNDLVALVKAEKQWVAAEQARVAAAQAQAKLDAAALDEAQAERLWATRDRLIDLLLAVDPNLLSVKTQAVLDGQAAFLKSINFDKSMLRSRPERPR